MQQASGVGEQWTYRTVQVLVTHPRRSTQRFYFPAVSTRNGSPPSHRVMKRYEMSPQPAKTVAHPPPILLASGRLLAPSRTFSVSIHAQSDPAASPTRLSRSPRCLRRVPLRFCLELCPQSSSIDDATTSRA